MKVVVVSQARMGSTRFPGKVLKTIDDKTLLEIHIERLQQSELKSDLIVATTTAVSDDAIEALCKVRNIRFFRGDEKNVLDRFYQATKLLSPEYVVRVTSDCPLLDADLLDQVVAFTIENKLDYCSNTLIEDFPDGQDIEVMTFGALEQAWRLATSEHDKEHVTPFIRKKSSFFGGEMFKAANYPCDGKFNKVRMTVDEQKDFEVINLIVKNLGTKRSWREYTEFYLSNDDIRNLNSHIVRNEGSVKKNKMSSMIYAKSDEYRKKVHKLIPGGAHTYSKGDDQFPALSPAAIAKGKGAWVWDIDGNKFLDTSMGLTSVTLGHAFEPVVERVKEELDRGVNFQRPASIELEMAEKFLSLVPNHDMIKFAKNGSIVTTAAVKLARASTKRKFVVFPSDHPFYSYDDWFIGKTACSAGVPEEITNLSLTFSSGKPEELAQLFKKYPGQIACVITEPEKNFDRMSGIDPEKYLKEIITITRDHGALFILDEMITGFKLDLPGAISKYKLDPDMATWGKSTANGFSFCALTGKRAVMELGGIHKPGMEKVFLTSTTHGGETHGLAAGLATIKFYRENNVIEKNLLTGETIYQRCIETVKKHGLENVISIADTFWMLIFVFKNKNGEIDPGMRTLFLQEMIKRGVLFQGAFVPSYSHSQQEIDFFCNAFSDCLETYKRALAEGYQSYLIGEPAKAVFRKYI